MLANVKKKKSLEDKVKHLETIANHIPGLIYTTMRNKKRIFFTLPIILFTVISNSDNLKALDKSNQEYAGVWSTKKNLDKNSNNLTLIGISQDTGYFHIKVKKFCQYISNATGSVEISNGQLKAPASLSSNGQTIIKEKYPIDKTPYKESGTMVMELDGNKFYKVKEAPFHLKETKEKLRTDLCDTSL